MTKGPRDMLRLYNSQSTCDHQGLLYLLQKLSPNEFVSFSGGLLHTETNTELKDTAPEQGWYGFSCHISLTKRGMILCHTSNKS